jgi:hypothetical protein
MKLFWSKHKRIIWIAFAIVFIVVLIFIKYGNLFKGAEKYLGINQQTGLSYNPNMSLEDLVNMDTDGDGIPDWEEKLFGTDPTKAETVPGVPDSVTIEKLRAEQTSGAVGQTSAGNQDNGSLSQTDQFGKELLATISTLTENGAIDSNGSMDQATADKLSSSLENSIENTATKIYTLADIKVINDNTPPSIKKYANTVISISTKNPTKYSVMDVLQKFNPDGGNTVDPTVLPQLDPIIKQMNDVINGMLATEVPSSLAPIQLGLINSLEKVTEDLNNIELYNTDSILAFKGITAYQTDANSADSAFKYLAGAIIIKLKG